MRRLISYVILAFLISWTIWLPLYLPQLGLPSLPMPYQHVLGAAGPLLSAVLATLVFDGPAGLVGFLRRSVAWPAKWWLPLAALTAPFAVGLAAAGVSWVVEGKVPTGLFQSPDYPTFSPILLLLFYTLSFGLGEEFGWRGFGLPELRRKLPAIPATVVLALIWAAWHLPMFVFWPSFAAMGWGALGWFASLLLGAFIMTLLVELGSGSLLAPILFHGAVNTALACLGPSAVFQTIGGMLVTLAGLGALYLLRAQRVDGLQFSRVAK